MSRKMFHGGLGLIACVAFAGCDDSSSSSSSDSSIPAYTVVQESASDPITEDANGCVVFPVSFGMISFDGGIEFMKIFLYRVI